MSTIFSHKILNALKKERRIFMQELGVEKAIQFCGGSVTELARKLRIEREEVYRYRYGRSSIKPEIAIAIERVTQGKVTCQEILPWKLKNLALILQAPWPTREIRLEDITIPPKVPHFPDQKHITPPNQKPICVDENNQLIYGIEAIEACKQQGKKSVLAWRISLLDLWKSKYEVEDLVRTFDQIERSAIEIALKMYIGERRGRGNVGNLPTLKGIRSRDKTSELLGFNSSRASRRLNKILMSNCCAELFYHLRHNKITVSKAAALADLPLDKQIIRLSKTLSH
jgi:DNA-binding transcriptional regulator YdaS (Cro superfamily)